MTSCCPKKGSSSANCALCRAESKCTTQRNPPSEWHHINSPTKKDTKGYKRTSCRRVGSTPEHPLDIIAPPASEAATDLVPSAAIWAQGVGKGAGGPNGGGARGPGKGGGWWRGGGSLVYLGEVDRWVNLLQLKVRFQGFTSWGIGPRLTDSVLRASHPHRSSFLRP